MAKIRRPKPTPKNGPFGKGKPYDCGGKVKKQHKA